MVLLTTLAVGLLGLRAKLNVAGTELAKADANDVLQAAPRPNLGLSAVLKQPVDQWPARAAKVSSVGQIGLDRALTASTKPVVGADFTTHAMGLLTNPLAGGLKGDLSLGFEMSETEFAAAKWGEVTNPFRNGTLTAYKGQQPLYTPLVPQGGIEVMIQFGAVKNFVNKFNAGHTATFDSLRSHYRMYQQLYPQKGQITAFERPGSHVAWPRVSNRLDGKATQLALRPILDRLLYFHGFSSRVSQSPRHSAMIHCPVRFQWPLSHSRSPSVANRTASRTNDSFQWFPSVI